MTQHTSISAAAQGHRISFTCDDGVVLAGDLWRAERASIGRVIINPATGVLARYYHRYARFLSSHGFDVLTYDYRGIGGSRPDRLQGCGYRWHDWGVRDFEAALRFMHAEFADASISVVGHSFGGVIPGLAASAGLISRVLTVGAQYAWPGDYAPRRRLFLIAKWHMVMPVLTAICGYFPGKRLGWLEDLPAGVAHEWSFRRPGFESGLPRSMQLMVRERLARFAAPVLAVAVADDELGTIPALSRTLNYYSRARRDIVLLRPADYERRAIGHFNLFRDEHADGFWRETLQWLQAGENPWSSRVVAHWPPAG